MIVPPPAPPGANGVAQRRNNQRLGGLLHILLWIGTALVLAGAILALLREGQLPHTTVPIARLAGAPSDDELLLRRLKKRKLQLKDRIAVLQRMLEPDEPA